MTKYLNIVIGIWLLPVTAFAQIIFEKTFGGTDIDEGYSVQQTSDGGYIIAGYTQSYGAGSRDVYLIKTDSLGDTLWTNTYGGSSWDYGYAVRQIGNGGYVIAGHTWSFGAGWTDVYLIKTDSMGDTLWTRTYGGTDWDEGYSVHQTLDDGYIIAGSTKSYGLGSRDVYLIKTDSLGNTLWTRTYGGTGSDRGSSVQQTVPDGGYIITGSTISFGAGSGDVYLVKTDSLGDTLWTRTYGGTEWDQGNSVQQTRDEGYIIGGYTESFGEGWADVYLIKTDSLGDTLWTRTYGGTDWDEGQSIQQTRDGGYIITGSTESFGSGIRNVYLIKTDSSGNTLWTRTYGGTVFDRGTSVQLTSDGGYIIAGYTNSFGAGSGDIYLIKPDFWGPVILSAVADDGIIPFPGIDNDDYVLITFNEVTNKPYIYARNINAILSLSGGHSWLDGNGFIERAIWNSSGDQLAIALSETSGPPSVAVGDTITPDSVTITDLSGNKAFISVVITGSFDPQTGIEEGSQVRLPKVFRLHQNHPNPFHKHTAISYKLRAPSHTTLQIYDLAGRLLETLMDERQEPGFYQVQWEGKDHANGIYFYRLSAGDTIASKKMVLFR
jgi:hypothetical protein